MEDVDCMFDPASALVASNKATQSPHLGRLGSVVVLFSYVALQLAAFAPAFSLVFSCVELCIIDYSLQVSQTLTLASSTPPLS